MRALIVYESMYGNTHIVADHIAEGLRSGAEVSVVPVDDATRDAVLGADLVVVGGPTHAHGMTTEWSRKAAVDAAAKPGSGLEVGPDAESFLVDSQNHLVAGEADRATAWGRTLVAALGELERAPSF
jgi:hypothetical protein